ncbi:MAG: phosphoglucosamine mutase [Ignavibacteriales bacterium]|nr:phosphoglucosamine mutase [Ignavibacteriales bacterium]
MSVLMVSISGIRGLVGNGLSPEVLVKYTAAYAEFIGSGTVVVGRDSRITGEMVNQIVVGTLLAKGLNVVQIGICPTPTVQYTVKTLGAQGGIAISASHNPNEWNALKLLNSTGQFMTPEEHQSMKAKLDTAGDTYKAWDKIGKLSNYEQALQVHKDAVLNMKYIDREAIIKRKFKVLADCVNGAGYKIIPELLRDFGCEVIEMHCDDSGIFPRLPEPLPENLTATMQKVKDTAVDFAVVVDPDVDRLVLITEKGNPFSEENTITQAVKFITSKQPGNVAINLSTTRAVEDVAAANNSVVFRSAVGEANVVLKMKECNAVIGGEGSGGVIYPEVHYGRDALIGIAITLQHLLEFGGTLEEMKAALPQYFIAKKKFSLGDVNPDKVIDALKEKHKDGKIATVDGLRIDFDSYWIHLRKSNTEPIIRVICEAKSEELAAEIIAGYETEVMELLSNQM